MIERILVPMDGSRQSQKALDWAIDMAKKYDSRIMILRVVTLSMLKIAWSTPSGGGPVIKNDFLEEAEKKDKRTMNRIRQYLREKVKAAEAEGIPTTSCVMAGDPADSIKDCCKQEKIDLVVMNTHGKGWFKRAIMGSVTDEVLRSSNVPVLVIRPDKKK